jgi:uncharacterized protein YijF (DUF1287 family)
MERLEHEIRYDGRYRSIPYPNGDVPAEIGVCTDLVIRSYRALGVDLQQLVHEDMKAHFSAYPDRWGLSAPDPNIDHRRVPNLEVFFARHGERLPISADPVDYLPGELVTWNLGPLPHIGIVSPERTADGRRPLIVHNIGRGPELEDMLFDDPIAGRYRYIPDVAEAGSDSTPASGGSPSSRFSSQTSWVKRISCTARWLSLFCMYSQATSPSARLPDAIRRRPMTYLAKYHHRKAQMPPTMAR